jgi:hypothetical protein
MRHDGRYMIRHRAGDEVHTLAEWTEHEAVNRPTAEDGSRNRLAIDAGAGPGGIPHQRHRGAVASTGCPC